MRNECCNEGGECLDADQGPEKHFLLVQIYFNYKSIKLQLLKRVKLQLLFSILVIPDKESQPNKADF